MPASSDRLLVSSLRPWMPAENEPAEPNALTQLLQLTCSLTPSSTVPSTRLVIVWLKRWLARSPIEPPLESAPVGVGVGEGPVRRIGLADGGLAARRADDCGVAGLGERHALLARRADPGGAVLQHDDRAAALGQDIECSTAHADRRKRGRDLVGGLLG